MLVRNPGVAPSSALVLLLLACGGGNVRAGGNHDEETAAKPAPLVAAADPVAPLAAPSPELLAAGPSAPAAAGAPAVAKKAGFPPAPYCKPKSGTKLKLVEVTKDLEDPVYLTAPAGDPRLFIIEKPGRIRIVKDGALVATPYLDITKKVNAVGDERGFLGLAFHPGFAQNGRFFVFYTQADDGSLVVAEYGASPKADTAKPAEKRLITVPHRFDNHNGGTLEFGPDGFLYISMGDGGAANDYVGSGQNKKTVLGKILRIDIDKGSPYGIPASNPWASKGGQREMFAWGLRNPWRFSVDVDGTVYIGDVGQGTVEEVNVVPAGQPGLNFGWPVYEGSGCFVPEHGSADGRCKKPEDKYVMPATEYNRTKPDTGCSVIGGYVYRGTCMPDYVGTYFFGDYCTALIHTFVPDGAKATKLTDRSEDLQSPQKMYGELASFGVDGYGELYAIRFGKQGPGIVYRIAVE